MMDIFALTLVYVIVTAIALWAVQSFFKETETDANSTVSLKVKVKLAAVCSASFLIPLAFIKSYGFGSMMLYFITVPIAIFAIKKSANHEIGLKTAFGVFIGIYIKFIFASAIVGAVARVILKIARA